MPIHWAAAPENGVLQRCSICGAGLVDYTSCIPVVRKRRRFFEGAVDVSGVTMTPTQAPPDCCPAAKEEGE